MASRQSRRPRNRTMGMNQAARATNCETEGTSHVARAPTTPMTVATANAISNGLVVALESMALRYSLRVMSPNLQRRPNGGVQPPRAQRSGRLQRRVGPPLAQGLGDNGLYISFNWICSAVINSSTFAEFSSRGAIPSMNNAFCGFHNSKTSAAPACFPTWLRHRRVRLWQLFAQHARARHSHRKHTCK